MAVNGNVKPLGLVPVMNLNNKTGAYINHQDGNFYQKSYSTVKGDLGEQMSSWTLGKEKNGRYAFLENGKKTGYYREIGKDGSSRLVKKSYDKVGTFTKAGANGNWFTKLKGWQKGGLIGAGILGGGYLLSKMFGGKRPSATEVMYQ